MISVYLTEDGMLHEPENIVPGAWIHLLDPSASEVERVARATGADPDFLKAALDEEERPRLELDEDQLLILVDTPIVESQGQTFVYTTMPFGILWAGDNLITVCLKETALVRAFAEGIVRSFSTKKRSRLTLQMLYRNSSLFLFYLRQVDKASTRVENQLHQSMKNKELIQMLGLEKSLVYFSTALKSNEIVLERLGRNEVVRRYEEDLELLEDVIIENKQAIEMASIYRDILSGTMDAFASLISNNQNQLTKRLTAVLILLAVPALLFAFFGMNLPLPFAANALAPLLILLLGIGAAGVAAFALVKRNWF